MRTARLGELLTECSPDEGAWLLDSLATAGRAGGPPYDLALLAAVDLTREGELPYETRRALFEAARSAGLQACEELLFSTRVAARAGAGEPRPLVPGTRPVTLGERKALARSWRRDVLERLVVDPHADVVRLLLANPHVTESDIVRIATSRRSHADILELVLASRRFGTRPRVRRALVRNPNLAIGTGLRLVGLLNAAELRELSSDPALDPRLGAAIRRRLRPVS